MSLTQDDLELASATIADRVIRPPKTSQHIRPSADALRRLRLVHSDAIAMIETRPQVFDHPEAARAIEQSLIVAMIGCLTRDARPELGSGRRQGQRIMRQFEEWLEANLDRPVHLMDICAVLGVPARTLNHHCRQHLGMGPAQYLRLRRMKMVRRELLRADSSTTVAEVAMRFGFWELGRFAGAYRACFGELPSTTLGNAIARI